MRDKMQERESETTVAFEKLVAGALSEERYVLRLYVTGMSPRSTEAFNALLPVAFFVYLQLQFSRLL